MTAYDINISKDKDNDVLYVLKSGVDSSSTKNFPVNANLVVRFRDNSDEIIGFTIDEFSSVCADWINKSIYELMEEFDCILKVLNDKSARQLTQAASQVTS